MSRMLALAVPLALALGLTGRPAGAQDLEALPPNPKDMELEVRVEQIPGGPYEQEMVLLTIRGYYPRSIARQVLEQPDFAGFGWMQLGRDRWQDDMHEGRQVSMLERTMVVFPERSGRLEVGPFLHHVTTVTGTGNRVEHLVHSEPFALEVRPKPEDAGWWLPARGVTMTETWDKPPDRLALGELATRTVTLEVAGLGPQRLPPAPELHAKGVIVFTDPEQRTHELTPDGPISRVTWRWTLRPMTGEPSTVAAVRVTWFDTRAREAREIVLPAQRIALAGAIAAETGPRSWIETLADRALPIGALAGLLLGLAVLLPGLRLRTRAEVARLLRRLRPDPGAAALRRAARAGDTPGVWRAARALLRRDRAEGAAGALGPTVETGLARLDRALFGPAGAASAVDLRGLARGLLAARRRRAAP